MATVLCVVGARPNFVKTAPVHRGARRPAAVAAAAVHTGQHYDRALSDVVPRAARTARRRPPPRRRLRQPRRADGGGAGRRRAGPARATGRTSCVVAGDVNSTLARGARGGQAAASRWPTSRPGLRSRDWTMPEEINRVAHRPPLRPPARALPEARRRTCAARAIAADRIALVGNTMIDSLFALLPRARDAAHVRPARPRAARLRAGHPAPAGAGRRPGAARRRRSPCSRASPRELPVVFPMHPRTRARLEAAGLAALDRPARCSTRSSYLDFLALEAERAARRHRLGRRPGGDLGARRAVPHLPHDDRAAGHDHARHEPPGRARSGAAADGLRRGAGSTDADGRARIPLWDGHAGGRAADAIAELLGDRPDPPATRVSASGR